QAPHIGSSQTFWCLQKSGCFNPASTAAEGMLAGTNFGNVTYQTYSGVQTIASLSSAVPEPATWAMMIMGFGLVGSAVRRRNLLTLAAAA
ncbi:MAG: PEPxxWA-CTERM sorting domain-containing protein, partial [Phenylobacterium sp.]